jgi:agmatine deiminase
MKMSNSPDENLYKAIKLIKEGISRGAQILCLPELFRSPYFCTESTYTFSGYTVSGICAETNKNSAASHYGESLPGAVLPPLCDLARAHKIVIVAGSVYEHDSSTNCYYNTSAVIDTNGEIKGIYRKSHIPHDLGFYEKDYFTPGTNDFKPVQTSFGKIGVLICFDQWFPEAARALALQGAEYIFYPTAIGSVLEDPQKEGSWHDAWETIQRGHSIANSIVVAAANRIGIEGHSTFWGGSFITNHFGVVVAKASASEEVILAKIDRAEQARLRAEWGFLSARRPELYKTLYK